MTIDEAASGQGWEHFPHLGDVGIRGYGATKAQAFENAARAMMAVVVNPAELKPRETVEIHCSAPNDDFLLLDWLNAIIFEMATRNMLFCDFSVEIEDSRLVGRACGEPVDVARHAPAVELKGATMTALRVVRGPDGRWVAQCVVDV